MILTKKLNFDNETLDILGQYFQVEPVNAHFVGRLSCGQLDRKVYEKVNKALETMGGKWNRKAGGHIFTTDPREHLNGLLDSGSLTVVRDGWFPTPEPVVARMFDEIGYEGGWILEPSAGEGAIADYLVSQGVPQRLIETVEKNRQRADVLQRKGYKVGQYDFLTTGLDTFGNAGFRRVFMNPPFEEGQDIDHVQHAYKLLAVDGALVSIMSEGPFFRQDNKARGFRSWLTGINGYSVQLPEDAFKASGTWVQARMVIIHN